MARSNALEPFGSTINSNRSTLFTFNNLFFVPESADMERKISLPSALTMKTQFACVKSVLLPLCSSRIPNHVTRVFHFRSKRKTYFDGAWAYKLFSCSTLSSRYVPICQESQTTWACSMNKSFNGSSFAGYGIEI